MVTIIQKSMRYTPKKEKNPNITLKIVIKSQRKRAKEEKNKKELQKQTINKMPISTYLLIIGMKIMKIYIYIILSEASGNDPKGIQQMKKEIDSRKIYRASLVAQWLRICLPMQGTRVRALVWEDPTCRGATGPVSHNY